MLCCPKCGAGPLSAWTRFEHLIYAEPIRCRACGERFRLKRRTRWGPFVTGAVYQVMLVGGVIISFWIDAWWPFATCVALMMLVEGLANWFGEGQGLDSG